MRHDDIVAIRIFHGFLKLLELVEHPLDCVSFWSINCEKAPIVMLHFDRLSLQKVNNVLLCQERHADSLLTV